MTLDVDRLAEYERLETARGTAKARSCAPDGLVADIRALYSDRVELGEIVPAFHRPGTPLYLLPAFSKRVVAFLPPLPKNSLESRYGGTPFELFLMLVRSKYVIPVIGWPLDYRSEYCSYLAPIFDLEPVSMPARGHALVHATGGSEYFERARKDERLVELSQLVVLKNRWGVQFPHMARTDTRLQRRVLDELVNNYVDLCIFGYQGLLEEILSFDQPFQRADYLLKASEILTYPSLIGLDGRSHYNVVRAVDALGLKAEQEPRILSLPVVKAIIDGVGFDLHGLVRRPEAYVSVIEDLHHAGVEEDISRIHDEFVSSALKAEDITDEALNEKAKEFARTLDLAYQEIVLKEADIVRSVEGWKTRIAVGVTVLGALGSFLARQFSGIGWEYALSATVGSTALATYLKERSHLFHSFIEKRTAKRVFARAMSFDLWQLTRKMKQPLED